MVEAQSKFVAPLVRNASEAKMSGFVALSEGVRPKLLQPYVVFFVLAQA
jgi:hypothetical protein